MILGVVMSLTLAGGAAPAEQGFLWDGHHWPGLSYDAKVGYIKGVGNLADFEMAAAKGRFACISKAFVDELQTKTINQIIKDVDDYYRENPGKLDTPVIEVMLRRCTKLCPPEPKGGGK
jgi:hypothetical protein